MRRNLSLPTPRSTFSVRVLQDDSTVDGIVYPKGVAPCPAIVLHQRADLYRKPKVLRPERFLKRGFAPHECMRRPPLRF